ncbi:uncharacterized protein LOC116843621 isoform X2 [Odontomachus brunneus]|uniref:uncharacterized protein LOC116843621 isoform X2 n=1 Tax=Odontomachus brunneus TaxID=486640 RepID=UPI0013F1FE2A|nr:uncharacterized protein LOC116843621 isoform X2 [Odontomachus brunneus]
MLLYRYCRVRSSVAEERDQNEKATVTVIRRDSLVTSTAIEYRHLSLIRRACESQSPEFVRVEVPTEARATMTQPPTREPTSERVPDRSPARIGTEESTVIVRPTTRSLVQEYRCCRTVLHEEWPHNVGRNRAPSCDSAKKIGIRTAPR